VTRTRILASLAVVLVLVVVVTTIAASHRDDDTGVATAAGTSPITAAPESTTTAAAVTSTTGDPETTTTEVTPTEAPTTVATEVVPATTARVPKLVAKVPAAPVPAPPATIAAAPAAPAAPATPPAPRAHGPATLVWSDEFNGAAGTGADPSTWEQEVGAPTNLGRVEYLTDGTRNVVQDGAGNLVITARRESYGGRSYTSGRLESYKSFTTGYLEFRAKVPTWQGTMPGLWTYGAAGYGAGTGFSELDALEIQTANDIDPTAVRQTVHGGMPDGSIWQLGWSQNRVVYAPNRPGDAWHTYGVFVDPADHSITFYADGVPRAHYAQGQQPGGGVWPYGVHAQKAIVEIEMGGYSRTPTADRNSDTLTVDYVRVYDQPPY
jgi:beta-glucanase (GH16 family)